MNLRVVYTTAALVAIVLTLQLLAPPAVAQEAATKSVEIQQPVSIAPADSSATQEIDAPSTVRRNQAEAASQTAPGKFELAQVQMKNEGAGATQEPVQSTPPQQPQGAAAARIQPATGTAASKPAGAAIAPAKQRRVRTFLIRLAPLAGAGVALATVFALSSASPSKPPGAH